MRTFLKALEQRLEGRHTGPEPDVLDVLFECYNEIYPFDDDQIKADFRALYAAMNDMELRQMDNIIYPVCTLCRDHERTGFVEGIRVGIRLAQEFRTE